MNSRALIGLTLAGALTYGVGIRIAERPTPSPRRRCRALPFPCGPGRAVRCRRGPKIKKPIPREEMGVLCWILSLRVPEPCARDGRALLDIRPSLALAYLDRNLILL